MRIRKRDFKVGQRVYVWTVAKTGYKLPPELPEGARVKVVEIDVHVDVEHRGKVHRLDQANIDSGYDCEVTPDQWELYQIAGFKEPLAKWRVSTPPHLRVAMPPRARGGKGRTKS